MKPDFKSDAAVIAIQPEVSKLTSFARTLVIRTAEGYEQAADYLKTIKGLLGKIEDARTRITKPLLQAQRELNAQAKEAAAPLQLAESQIKRAMIAWQEEQERIRLEEQRKAEEAARKERERLEAQAQKAAAAGKVEKAEALEQRAASVVAPVIQREAPKVAGVRTSEVWRFEIVDEMQLPREFLIPNETAIRQVVLAMKKNTNIPGVRVWSEKSLAAAAKGNAA